MSTITTLNDGDAYDLWRRLWDRQENPVATKTISAVPSFDDVEEVPLTFQVLNPHPFFPASVNEIVVKSDYEETYQYCDTNFIDNPNSTVVASGHPGTGECHPPVPTHYGAHKRL
jgi:hypothetical protein